MDKFDVDFINQVICTGLKDGNILELLLSYIKPDYMPNDSYHKLWKCINTEFKLSETNSPPKLAILKMHFRKDDVLLGILTDIKEAMPDSDHSEDVLRNLEAFVKQNMFVEIYNEVGDQYNKGKQTEAFSRFIQLSEKFAQFSIRTKKFSKVFGNYEKRKIQREFDKLNVNGRIVIPTGIDELDEDLGGGFETGTFVLITGESGTGKSFMGNHLGVHAAKLGYEVLHEQAEGTEEQVMDRYDSAWTGTRYYDVKQNNFGNEQKIEKIKRVLRDIKGEIHVNAWEKFGGRSLSEVRQNIRDLKKQGHDIKMVILDYLELASSGDNISYGPNDEKIRQPKLAQACKEIAMEENLVFVAFTQSTVNDPALKNDPNFVITRFHLAEAKGKVKPADVHITINQTRDEKKEQIIRLFEDKTREHSGGKVVLIYGNLSRSRFYDRKRTLNEFYSPNENE